jgi:Fungal Zn(2)-Cys(6) binuclear cluster domain/Aflatoxin regulatory protein
MDTGGRCFAPQKLKDSCDKCSASKVRCTKEKPTCGRCDRLGYPCSYRPARRVGRPYRPRTSSSDNQTDEAAAAEAPVQRPRLSRFVDESVRLRSKFASMRKLHVSPGGNEEPGESDDKQHQDDVHDSSMSHSRQGDSSPSERDLIQGPSIDASTKPPTPLLDTSNSTCTTTSSLSEDASRNPTIHDWEKNKTGSNASEPDCATVAMDMLQQLDLTNAKLQAGAIAGLHIDAQTLGAAIHTVTTTFRRLPTILICPCSERSDVGLLAAAVCVTTLDVHGIILSNSTRRNKEQPSPTVLLLEDPPSWDRMDLCTEYFGVRPEEEEGTTIRALAELAKVAKVVLQFTKRYSDRDRDRNAAGEDLCSPDFLPALATFLRCRLQSITKEATDWLA